MHHYRKHRVLILTMLRIVALFVALALLVLLTDRVDVSFGDATNHFFTHADILIVFFGAVQAFFLLGSLYAFSQKARDDGLRQSKLLRPLMAVKLGIAAVLILSATISFDLLSHNLRPHWHALYTPSLRAVQNLLLLLTIFALSWLHLSFLTLWGWTRRRIVTLVAAMLVTTALVTALAYVIATAY